MDLSMPKSWFCSTRLVVRAGDTTAAVAYGEVAAGGRLL